LAWVIYSGRFTHISSHPSAVCLAQDRESSLVKDRRSTTAPLYRETHYKTFSLDGQWLWTSEVMPLNL